MKTINWLSLPILLSLTLIGCGGGDDSPTADGSGTEVVDEVHSAMFNNPAFVASWGEKGVFTDANTCSSCHTGNATVMEFNGKDVSPYTEWKHSTMANALNDPYFNAVVEEETHIFPHLKGFIEDSCLSCHSPMAYTHAHQTGEALVSDATTTLLADGAYPFATAIGDDHAREGISCTACHQIQSDDLGSIASMSGHYKINSTDDNMGSAPAIFGPFKNLTENSMVANTQYKPEYAAHIAESAMCASCHNLYTPSLNLDGTLAIVSGTTDTNAQFPEQTPYWEWLNSDYSDPAKENKTCQACHMAEPEADYKTRIATRKNGTENTNFTERPDVPGGDDANSFFAVHEFVGGNSYLLTLLKTYMTELGLGSASGHSAQGFQDQIEATQIFLSSAAELTVNPSLTGSTLEVPVTITNKTGHKLPTSYPSRRMWIHMKVTDNNGNTVFESGAVDSNGRIAKDNATNGFTQSKCLEILKQPDAATFDSVAQGCYEPHHNIINNPNQVAIYEGVLGDVNQDITHVLLHARQYIKDNRIPPKGWTLAGQHTNPADPAIKDDGIVGSASTDGDFAPGKEAAGGSDATDTVTYSIDVSAGTAPFSVTADLYYQTIKPSFVLGMHADDVAHGGITGDSYVGRFKEMYKETPPMTETLASQTVAVP
ncbi:hypothetical protein [Thiomicrorhabdus lithotrophica]|uniref:Cytochrome c-552/4 domain-containing protein n=1 Tax=Thiomicrorhabdus lithotrophica TaxID=2949997 RepID=A0ABY8C8N4_9GAMM|nr:hypothetical protein [Thiomicrorhabdus lithotrophica]WEJ62331.1 hypothetical protein NR989_09960 [Thiomicrorhabdus lithotrophica]